MKEKKELKFTCVNDKCEREAKFSQNNPPKHAPLYCFEHAPKLETEETEEDSSNG